jgi:hypothetical protein
LPPSTTRTWGTQQRPLMKQLICYAGWYLSNSKNGFNELSRKAMLWMTRHFWANGSRFAFNCYLHSLQLILHLRGEPCEILLSREGVT